MHAQMSLYMAHMVKWLTHRIVAPTRAGSIPVMRPTYDLKYAYAYFFLFYKEILGAIVFSYSSLFILIYYFCIITLTLWK